MSEHSLGPNGGLVFCMDYLEKNIDWVEEKLKPLIEDHYLLFDFLFSNDNGRFILISDDIMSQNFVALKAHAKRNLTGIKP